MSMISRVMILVCGQLTKVNAVTLAAWLKQRGVSCKSKDKKTDLVEKVLHTLSLSTSEQ